MQGKHSFVQDCYYFQGIFSYINQRDTSSLDCKHKHMLENGAPPDKCDVLYTSVSYRIPWFKHQDQCFGVITLVPAINSIFTDGMGPFKSLSTLSYMVIWY